ncbi:uncharacterized protein TNCT_602181 [Trichonephila clavata]|uniref:Uncharacterized protein n=1 Tax=Trichonephila clavata TaxID=2740835 RepID=A0A8X6G300_TRICU|nr:uncharacterized protein TNCT_602181 [Trichonephila clavata]
MLHRRKIGSILQWYNTLKQGDVTSLAQFTDGSLFYDIVTSLNFTYSAKENDAKAEAAPTDSMERMDNNVEQINTINKESVETGQSSQSAVSDFPEVGENENIDSEKKYDSVKKCIDDIFQIDSISLINYSECLISNELELAKVAVFLLTALVEQLLSTDKESTKSLTQLDSQVQEDIQEFLSFVLTDRSQEDGPIKKSEFHKLLSLFPGIPHRRQYLRSSGSTDHSKASDGGKKRKDRASSIVYEDNQDSPLKTLLESAKFQQKVAMYKKESELKKLRNVLFMEKKKVLDLVAEKNILNEKLESTKVAKLFSNVTNVNEVTIALLKKKEQELKTLLIKVWDETENRRYLEALLKFAEKEKMEQDNEIIRDIMMISSLDSCSRFCLEEVHFREENCTQCMKFLCTLKNSRANSNNSKEQEVSDLQFFSTNSREFPSEAENATSVAEKLGLLQSNLIKYSNLFNEKNYVEFDSSMRVPNSDFVLLQKMIQNLVRLIQRKNYVLDAQVLVKLEEELSNSECIQQIILAVNCIINALKLSISNKPNGKSSDPRVKALTLKKKDLEMENKSLKQELIDINKFLEVKEAESQVVKNEWEELQSLKKEQNEKIDKVNKEAEGVIKKYEDAKKIIENKNIELRKLMKLYMKLVKPYESRSSCDECEKLQQKIKELQSQYSDKEQVFSGLKSTKKNLELRVKSYDCQVKQLRHEEEKLKFKNQGTYAYLSGTYSDRNEVWNIYFDKALAAIKKEEEALRKAKKAQSCSTIPSGSGNTYTMSGGKISKGGISLSPLNPSIHSKEREGSRKQNEETDSDNSEEHFILNTPLYPNTILNKRKMPDDDNVTNASMKIFCPSSEKKKEVPLLKRGTSLLKMGTMKTPLSLLKKGTMRIQAVKKGTIRSSSLLKEDTIKTSSSLLKEDTIRRPSSLLKKGTMRIQSVKKGTMRIQAVKRGTIGTSSLLKEGTIKTPSSLLKEGTIKTPSSLGCFARVPHNIKNGNTYTMSGGKISKGGISLSPLNPSIHSNHRY